VTPTSEVNTSISDNEAPQPQWPGDVQPHVTAVAIKLLRSITNQQTMFEYVIASGSSH